jgi:hypothetical protein
MKYLKLYSPEWDEVYQVEVADDDPVLARLPSNVEISSTPHRHLVAGQLPIRSRFASEADEQRRAERASAK